MWGGIKVKMHLKIIKELGLFILLFVLASAVATSENSYTVTVTIVQSSTSEDSNEMNTVISAYSDDGNSPATSETSVISGSGSSEITSEDDTVTDDSNDSGDSGADDSPSPGENPPDLQLDGTTYEDYSDELKAWISYIIDEDPLITIDDLPQDVTYITNSE